MEKVIEMNLYTNDMIIMKARRGCKEAFTEIIKDNKIYLYKMAFAYVKDENKALDIMQECIFRAYKGIGNLKNPQYFKTWITRILINSALDYLKKEKKNDYLEIDQNICVSEEYLEIDDRIDLYNAIDKLKPEFKTVIILKYFNDYSISEISEIINIPENTIKSHLSRGRKALRSILEDDKNE